MQQLTITAPDDWHIHLRDGEALPRTVNDAARQFRRAVCMPNLVPPVTTAAQAMAYRERIIGALEEGLEFEPLMVLYLTDHTTPQDIVDASRAGIRAVKAYPAGATTNSHGGVTDLLRLAPVFEALQNEQMLLLLHGEVTYPETDIFDREKIFIDQILSRLQQQFPALKIVLEHITTADAAYYVLEGGENIAATVTPQHLAFNRNDMLVGGIRPHLYCLPVLKRQQHQQVLLDVVTRGNPRFFIGTDSAPHARSVKEVSCGCAGCYSAPYAVAMYASIFEQQNRLDRLEGFLGFYGPDFYGLPRNAGKITLVRDDTPIPDLLPYPGGGLVPLAAGSTPGWRILPGNGLL